MAQTNLKSDDWCGYNQSAAPFYWVFEPGQYENTYSYGEVGINTAGGTGGSYVRPDVIDVSSFLSGRDDILSKCQPPVPSLDNINHTPLEEQDPVNTSILLPKYTKEKKAAVDLSAVDYNRWQPNIPDEPQNLRFVIEDMWPQRGGMDTQNYTKLAWRKGSFNYQDPNSCKLTLDPARACGPFCEPVSGYQGVDPLTGQKKTAVAMPWGKPPGEPDYPFTGPTSQQIHAVGAAACGDNFFSGPNNDQGSCPTNQPTVLANNTNEVPQGQAMMMN